MKPATCILIFQPVVCVPTNNSCSRAHDAVCGDTNLGVGKFALYLLLFCTQINLSCNQHPASTNQANADSTTVTMVKIPGGTFNMGTNDPAFPDAKPVHAVTVSAFLMDEHEVTNAQFEKFVNATHYITVAEQKPQAKDYPGVPEENLIAGSAEIGRAS